MFILVLASSRVTFGLDSFFALDSESVSPRPRILFGFTRYYYNISYVHISRNCPNRVAVFPCSFHFVATSRVESRVSACEDSFAVTASSVTLLNSGYRCVVLPSYAIPSPFCLVKPIARASRASLRQSAYKRIDVPQARGRTSAASRRGKMLNSRLINS